MVGYHDVGPRSFERCQDLYDHLLPAGFVRRGVHDHCILAADVVHGHGTHDVVSDLSYNIEVGQPGFDHDDVRPLAFVHVGLQEGLLVP